MVWDGINKRRFPRVSYKCLIRVFNEGAGDTIETFTENIGSGGICVGLDQRLSLFEKVGMRIFIEEGASPVSCKGTVVWVVKRHASEPKIKDHYDTGIEFQDISEEDRKRIETLIGDILESEA